MVKFHKPPRPRMLQLPCHYDFQELRLIPAQTRARLEQFGRCNVVAFQTRNPLHRVHEELTKRAIQEVDGGLLLHPVVGMTKPGDVDHYTRVRTYKALAQLQALVYLPEGRYEEVSRIPPKARTASISGTQVREEYLNNGHKLPDWFTRPEVAEILAETYPPRYRQKEDRDTNIRRIGFVAAEIDDPYEPPRRAEIRLDTVTHTPEENAHLILDYLTRRGFIRLQLAPDRDRAQQVATPVASAGRHR